MTRSRRSARDAGTRFERSVADCLAWQLRDDRIDRRVKTGAQDKGDIGGLRTRDGQRLVVECKDTVTLNLSGWVREAATEAVNDHALAGVVIHKRRGVGDPLEQYVTMTVRDLLLIGWGVAAVSQ